MGKEQTNFVAVIALPQMQMNFKMKKKDLVSNVFFEVITSDTDSPRLKTNVGAGFGALFKFHKRFGRTNKLDILKPKTTMRILFCNYSDVFIFS